MERDTNSHKIKQNAYKTKCLEMLEYIENNHNGKKIKIDQGSKVVDADRFLISHRLVIKTWIPLSSTWNKYASRIKKVYDNLNENRTKF